MSGQYLFLQLRKPLLTDMNDILPFFFDGVSLGCCSSVVVVMVSIRTFPGRCAIKICEHWINHGYSFLLQELIVFIFNFSLEFGSFLVLEKNDLSMMTAQREAC